MEYKPQDFFIGVIDLFAVILPGAAATWLLQRTQWLETYFNWKDDSAPWWIGFGFGAFLLGHLVFLLGSWLDPLYDRQRRRRTFEEDATFRAAQALRHRLSPGLRDSSFSTLKWARAYIALRAPAARQEIDALEATSKFFRSLVVLFVLAALLSPVVEFRLPATIASLVLAWLCFLRFCDQRWKLTEAAYAYAILLADPRTAGTAAREGKEGKGAGEADEDAA